MADDDYCYLTTTGRRTGTPHEIDIWYVQVSDTLLYLLSGGGDASDWVRNLRAEPAVTVRVNGAVRPGRARVVEPETDEDARARTLLFEKYQPRYEGDLQEWRDRARPVAIELS